MKAIEKKTKKRDKKQENKKKNRIEPNEKKEKKRTSPINVTQHPKEIESRMKVWKLCVFFTPPKMCDDIEYQQMPWHDFFSSNFVHFSSH